MASILKEVEVEVEEVAIIINENKKLRGDLAAAQAEVKSLQEQAEKQKSEDYVNKITDISTFHSTDKLDLEKKNILHYFVASSHYYKMRKERTSVFDPFDDQNLTITYIENEALKSKYEKSKKDKQEKGELYEEILLFHGTDEENIDEIFIKNFDINRHPLKRKKVDR